MTFHVVTVQDSFGWPSVLSTIESQSRIEATYSAYDYPNVNAIKAAPVQNFSYEKMTLNAVMALGILVACGVLCELILRRRIAIRKNRFEVFQDSTV